MVVAGSGVDSGWGASVTWGGGWGAGRDAALKESVTSPIAITRCRETTTLTG